MMKFPSASAGGIGAVGQFLGCDISWRVRIAGGRRQPSRDLRQPSNSTPRRATRHHGSFWQSSFLILSWPEESRSTSPKNRAGRCSHRGIYASHQIQHRAEQHGIVDNFSNLHFPSFYGLEESRSTSQKTVCYDHEISIVRRIIIAEISSAIFDCSAPNLDSCPDESLPEFAFVGRPNVGKSSAPSVSSCSNSGSWLKVVFQRGRI